MRVVSSNTTGRKKYARKSKHQLDKGKVLPMSAWPKWALESLLTKEVKNGNH